jgi:hypothetical protein
MSLKITRKEKKGPETITFKTTDKRKMQGDQAFEWWYEKDDMKLADQLIGTVAYLKQNQVWKQAQCARFARLYGNQTLFSFVGSNISKMDQHSGGIPADRPTFNLVSSVTDTLVSRLTQSRPAPVFLTDNSDYKERNLAKKLNNFILGEFYQTKAYELGEYVLRDALVMGTGCVKVYEGQDKKVKLDRVLMNELYIDLDESMYSDPRRLYQIKLIDRKVLASTFPKYAELVATAVKATIDSSSESSKTVSDLVMVVEGWSLPSGPDKNDGRHVIACSSGTLFEEEWVKPTFPFVFLHHKKRMLGFWSQGVAETLMGTQMELNSLLMTIARAIRLVGVPRVFIEKGSKVNKASNNNEVGVIVEYSGTKPSYEVAPCVPQEMYMERDRIIQYGYQQEGLSMMSASSQKPQGLDSGEAIRTYDDLNTDRFAALARRYDNFYIDLSYQIIDLAMTIAKREGSYQTVFPDRRGAKDIDLPKLTMLKDPFVIQCFNESSLPRDPAGRKQTVIEMIQSGMLSIKEGRRLLNYPDLEQMETLATASEERIFCYLDEIVENGKYNPPDPFMDLMSAEELVTQYYNLYECRKLEEARCQMLRDFFTQIQTLKQAAMPPQMPQGASPQGGPPQAVPQPPPVSPMLPNAPQTA